MRLFRFAPEAGRDITAFDSLNARISGVVHLRTDAHISCMALGAPGVVGYHPAVTPQLLLIVSGAGWVRGESTGRKPISTGQAVFWEKDEWHESGTEAGMTAIVIESDDLDLEMLVPDSR